MSSRRDQQEGHRMKQNRQKMNIRGSSRGCSKALINRLPSSHPTPVHGHGGVTSEDDTMIRAALWKSRGQRHSPRPSHVDHRAEEGVRAALHPAQVHDVTPRPAMWVAGGRREEREAAKTQDGASTEREMGDEGTVRGQEGARRTNDQDGTRSGGQGDAVSGSSDLAISQGSSIRQGRS